MYVRLRSATAIPRSLTPRLTSPFFSRSMFTELIMSAILSSYVRV